MELRTTSINFPSIRGNGPITQIANVHFPRDVQKAVAGITGYSAGFAGRNDHHLGKLQVQVDTRIEGDLVEVTGTFGLRDWSGEWDDDYEGNIQVIVVAELASAADPRPRGDLTITGMEITQAIQHFRSSEHLDSVNVRPDNSIPLIARKDTAVRVYVDYDRNSGLPLINNLSGELVVDTGFTTITLSPENTISPMRDNQIQRSQVDHTLNFVIPEVNCQTQLVLKCRVFDSAHPSPASRAFEKTIYFENRVPLNLYAVAVHYTGQGLDLAAPTLSDITGTGAFSKMEVVYPVPEVLISGFTVIDYNKDMKADINNGCGDGYNSLLDTLRDMQGSSDDVYYGFLPNGFDGGSVGGCGGGSGRVAASPFTAFGGLAQETGHAFGRKHAPCDSSSRCGNPANQDDSYPKYAEFDSDSIGEFGYNPRTDDLFSPVDAHDFMSYSGNRWVSPYTYMALLGNFPSSDGVTAFMRKALTSSGENKKSEMPPVTEGPWIKTPTMKLFLWMEIDRRRKVKRIPSFHFYTKNDNETAHHHTDESIFSVILVDENGETLTCQSLNCECENCFANCFPKSFRQYIPYDERAKKLIVYEEETVIYEEEIISPEEHDIKEEYENKKGFHLKWEPKNREAKEHWYLIHWQDEDQQWRGLEARSSRKEAFIPLHLFGRRKKMIIRLLASTGIATKIIEYTLKLPTPRDTEVTVLPLSNVKNRLTVAVFDNGKTVPDPQITWYNDLHVETGKGRSINLKNAKMAGQILHAVVFHNGKRYQNSFISTAEGHFEKIAPVKKEVFNNKK